MEFIEHDLEKGIQNEQKEWETIHQDLAIMTNIQNEFAPLVGLQLCQWRPYHDTWSQTHALA